MNFTFRPSLQAAAAVKIASELWTHIIQTEFTDPKWFLQENWEDLENLVEENLKTLFLNDKMLPEKFHQRIGAVIESIGNEIKWHISNYKHHWPKLLAHLEWTTQGMINHMKLAQKMVEDETISVKERYRIACCSCNEEKIQYLWDLIETRERSPGHFLYDVGYRKWDELVTLWTFFLQGKTLHVTNYKTCPSSKYTRNECGFEMAILKGHVTAVVYYFRKLTPRLREKYLTPNFIKDIVFGRFAALVSRGHSNAILFLLLSNMTERQQTEVFQGCHCLILDRLTDWPWQDFFMSIAMRVFPYMENDDYLEFLVCLSQKVIRNHWTYKKIFIDFWLHSSDELKNHAKESKIEILLLEPLLLCGNFECVNAILMFMSGEQKEKMLGSFLGKKVCGQLIARGDFQEVELLMNRCFGGDDRKIEDFKSEFVMTHGMDVCRRLVDENKWDGYKRFVASFFSNDESRNQFQTDFANEK